MCELEYWKFNCSKKYNNELFILVNNYIVIITSKTPQPYQMLSNVNMPCQGKIRRVYLYHHIASGVLNRGYKQEQEC